MTSKHVTLKMAPTQKLDFWVYGTEKSIVPRIEQNFLVGQKWLHNPVHYVLELSSSHSCTVVANLTINKLNTLVITNIHLEGFYFVLKKKMNSNS